jgi:hypothetical protein
MPRIIRYLAPTLLAFVMTDASAQTPPPAPCTDAVHRQFDFWVGSWDVTGPKGEKTIGRSRVESRLGDCVVHEHWFGGGGTIGESFNIYNATTGNWEQFWVDNGGNRLHLVGGIVGIRPALQIVAFQPGEIDQQFLRGRLAGERRERHSVSVYPTGQGFACQISAAYCAMVRSLENLPEPATLRIALRAHSSRSR